MSDRTAIKKKVIKIIAEMYNKRFHLADGYYPLLPQNKSNYHSWGKL